MTALIDRYAGIVCDLDGVVYRGPVAVDGAVEALNSLPIPVVYATNNASRPPEEVAAHLQDLGIHLTAQMVLNSSITGAAALRDHLPAGALVMAVGGVGVSQALASADLVAVEPGSRSETEISGVLQGYGPLVNATHLAEAAYAIEHGAVWVATNDDATLPTDRGQAPGNGALVAALRLAVDRDPIVVGKPHPPMYALAATRLGITPAQTLAVGDRLETDIEGAHATGMESALVLTGVHTVADAAAAAPHRRPTYLLADLRGLLEEYREPAEADGWWVCGSSRARWEGDRVVVEGPRDTIEASRATLAATWAHRG
ncbi:HAD-IIA family hydrolase [Kribbia dieselivorans]|uniref:HAD-IIA family hydrolase n=1 Tax=Kribbia dieselivorans TaxID=331526 RepID=UPI0008382BBE|nr:HAD-IIA family hydrolase [Kribbia dieselivorans]